MRKAVKQVMYYFMCGDCECLPPVIFETEDFGEEITIAEQKTERIRADNYPTVYPTSLKRLIWNTDDADPIAIR